MPDPDASKSEWRRWARTLGPVDPDISRRVAIALEAFLGDVDGPVLTYLPLADEVAIGALQVARPVLPRLGPDGTMTLHADDGRRERHLVGIDQPPGGPEPVDAGALVAVVVPGRVFDRDGYRLGRGGGHYDRLLPLLAPGTPAVGVTVEARIVDLLPRERHDVPMTHLATERGVRRV